MFLIELVLPFLIFCPRRLRFVAAFGILLLQICILITGNYNWFNLQTMLLCLLLFDDAALQKILPRRLIRLLPVRADSIAPRKAGKVIVGALALLIVFCSLVQMDERFGGSPPAAGAGGRRAYRTAAHCQRLWALCGHDYDSATKSSSRDRTTASIGANTNFGTNRAT